MKTSRGMSLVELLTVMSACTMILSLSAVLIHRSMRAQSQTRYFFENERNALRLARQLRRDAHEATAVATHAEALEIPADAANADAFLQLEFAGDDGTGAAIQYRRQPTGVERTVSRGGSLESREDFTLAAFSKLELHEEVPSHLLVLTVTADPADLIPALNKPAPTIRDTPVSLEIVARLGRDVRFVSPAANSKEASR